MGRMTRMGDLLGPEPVLLPGDPAAEERLAAGDTDEEIRDYVASRYPDGRQLLLGPSGSGFGALVWALPVVAAVAAVAALTYRFGDWKPRRVEVSDADRDLVAAALVAEGEEQ